MSYGVHAYVIDLPQVLGVFGTPDEAVRNRIKTALADEIAHLDDQFEYDISDDEMVPFAKALEHMLDGAVHIEIKPAQYWYLLEAICRAYGRQVGPSQFYQLKLSWLHQFPVLYSVAAHPGIFGKHLPPPDDFPGVGLIEPPDIGSKLDEAMTAARANADAEAAPLYEEYISWLNAAKASERSLATFMY